MSEFHKLCLIYFTLHYTIFALGLVSINKTGVL
jgi:hypothetical protein